MFAGISGSTIWVDASLERRTPERSVSDAIDLAQRLRPDVVAVESNFFQELLGAEFDRQCAARRIPPLPVRLVENLVSKHIRILRLGPYLSRRQMRFRNTPDCRRLVQQMSDFPVAEHDDGPDALELAVQAIRLTMWPGATDSDAPLEFALAR